MKYKYIIMALFVILTIAQEFHQHPPTNQQSQIQQTVYFANIGDYIQGRIRLDNQGVVLHNFLLDQKIDKKYLFITLQSKQLLDSPAIAVYNYQTRVMIKSCNISQFTECYIESHYFNASQKIVILVSAKSEGAYNLKTKWQDLEHLLPNQKMTFIFGEETSQLMHLQFNENEQFDQIRIILSPQTHRATYDKLKIFVNYGTNNEPTQQKHDLVSKRIWGEAEGVFITKKQMKNSNKLYIYITGNSETVYDLECEFIREQHHDIQLNEKINEYIEGKQQRAYHIDGSKYNDQFDGYIFKFSVFSGEIGIEMFTDKEMTKRFDRDPIQYMSDIQLFFLKDELLNSIKDIYIKLYCPDASAIYSISVQGRKENMAFQVMEDQYQFVLVRPGEKRSAYIRYPVFVQGGQQLDQNLFTFTATSLKVFGDLTLRFYACNVELDKKDKCINLENQEEFSQSVIELKPIAQAEAGEKVIYTLQASNDQFKYNTMVSKEIMIMAVVSSSDDKDEGKGLGLTVLQFSNSNKMKRIREDKSIEQQVLSQQIRFYKFLNTDPSVQEVKIYYNHISGFSRIATTREDPRINQNAILQKPGNQGSTVFEFTKKLAEPIYIVVQGITNSIYTLAATVRHEEHPESSALSLSQDIPYKFFIKPLQSMLIEIHPIQGEVTLKYSSIGGPIYICETNIMRGQCLNDKSLFVNLSASGQLPINSTGTSSIQLKIINGFNPYESQSIINKTIPNKVQVEVIYHDSSINHCEQKKMNEIYSEIFSPPACISFHIDSIQDIQIITKKQDIGQDFDYFFLCSKPITLPSHNSRYLLTKQAIQNSCNSSQNDIILMLMLQEVAKSEDEKIRYQYAVEYKLLPLLLKDGISYTYKGISTNQESALKSFFYEIIDVNATISIILHNKNGTQKFYANVISNQTIYHNRQVSMADAIINSENGQYYLNPSMEVTPIIIRNSGCTRNCVIFVSVFSTQRIGSQVQFAIEIVSSSTQLMEDSIKQDFVSVDSFKYYHYSMAKEGESLYIKTSDSNKHCSKIYISDKEFPSSSNLIKSEVNGELILEKTQKKLYYIGVQGIDNCIFSISVSQSNAKITKLQYGQFYDITLKEDEKKTFLVNHISTKPFKILTLQKHGSLTIYANQTFLSKQSMDLIASDSVKKEDFNFKSHYRNTLIVDNGTGYCFDCFYLVVVYANQNTDSSIVFVGEDAKVILPDDKILFDEMVNIDSKTLVQYYKASEGKLITKVHQGKVNINIKYNEQEIENSFSKQKKQYETEYSFEPSQSIFSPIYITVTPVEVPALYSIQMKPSYNSTTSATKILPGEHSYVHITPGSIQCITGYLRNKQEILYFSVSSQDDIKLPKLILNAQLNKQPTEKLKKTIIGNIMTVQFVFQSIFIQDAIEYEICLEFEHKDIPISLIIFQNQHVNILPTNTEYLVKDNNRFVMHPNGDILIDLFVCEGSADIRYSQSQQGLESDKPHDLQKISIPGQNHAIHLQEHSTIFMEVQASEATINWLPLNEEKERGTGYFTYDIGTLSYQSEFDKLRFIIGGIKQKKETKGQIKRIKYTLYIAQDKQDLKKAIMCEKFGQQVNKFIGTYDSQYSQILNKTITMLIDKKAIKDKFANQNSTLYYNVVADMVLMPPTIGDQNPEVEEYKFIYYQQQLAKQSFTFIKLFSLPMLIVLIIVGIVGFLIVTWVFMRVIVPTIGRLKNRMFIEEGQDKSIQIPQSSDRQQVVQMKKQPETQEQFQ